MIRDRDDQGRLITYLNDYQQQYFKKLYAWIKTHDYQSRLKCDASGPCIEIDIECVHQDGRVIIETETVRTYPEARIAMGY